MKKFSISYTIDVILDASEIWPDKDGPSDPTAADVLEVIEQCGGIRRVISDWDLDPNGDGHLDVYEVKSR